MGNEILLMDGVRYEEWAPTSHDELAQMIREHSKEIFGQESIYLDIRQKLKGGSLAAIPDAYCLTFGPDTFWVIEVERSAPDPYSHIVNQLSRFINGLDSPQSQRELRDAVYSNMSQSDRERAQSRSGGAVHPWLEKLINQPSLIVITEKATDEIRRAVATLRITPRVYEFRTLCRQGVGMAVHQHLFQPMVPIPSAPPSKPSLPVPELEPPPPPPPGDTDDTIVVPAREDGFLETFLGENRWYAIRINKAKIPQIKYIACYRVSPVSAITHWAPVESIQPWPDEPGRFVVNFAGKAEEIGPIKPTPDDKLRWLQGPAYTSHKKLQAAKSLDEVFR